MHKPLLCHSQNALARSQLRAGQVETGRKTCLRIADAARRLDSATLLARAALAYGDVLHYAAVNQTLVDLLRQALDCIGEDDSRLRARLLARLAAALQPAPEP